MKRLARIIISLVLLGVSLAGAVLLVWPAYQEFSLLRVQLDAKKGRIAQGEALLAALRDTEAKAQERREDFAKIEEAVPRDVALPALYDHIQKLAASSGVQLQSIEGKEGAVSEEELLPLVFQVNLEGSYGGLKQFLEAAQRSPRLINVRSLNVDSESESGTLQMTMELVAYARP